MEVVIILKYLVNPSEGQTGNRIGRKVTHLTTFKSIDKHGGVRWRPIQRSVRWAPRAAALAYTPFAAPTNLQPSAILQPPSVVRSPAIHPRRYQLATIRISVPETDAAHVAIFAVSGRRTFSGHMPWKTVQAAAAFAVC